MGVIFSLRHSCVVPGRLRPFELDETFFEDWNGGEGEDGKRHTNPVLGSIDATHSTTYKATESLSFSDQVHFLVTCFANTVLEFRADGFIRLSEPYYGLRRLLIGGNCHDFGEADFCHNR